MHQSSQTGLTEASRLAARECGAGTVVASAACVGYLYDVRLHTEGGGLKKTHFCIQIALKISTAGRVALKQTILWKFIMVLVALGSCLPSHLGRPLKNVATLGFSSSLVTVLLKIKL